MRVLLTGTSQRLRCVEEQPIAGGNRMRDHPVLQQTSLIALLIGALGMSACTRCMPYGYLDFSQSPGAVRDRVQAPSRKELSGVQPFATRTRLARPAYVLVIEADMEAGTGGSVVRAEVTGEDTEAAVRVRIYGTEPDGTRSGCYYYYGDDDSGNPIVGGGGGVSCPKNGVLEVDVLRRGVLVGRERLSFRWVRNGKGCFPDGL